MQMGKYYDAKIGETERNGELKYNDELQKCIKDTCEYCLKIAKGNDIDKSQAIMLLGKIQSGKTRAFTGLIALGFDNEFDMVFILTKNSKALVDQTMKRMHSEFKDAIDDHEVNVFDIVKKNLGLTEYELDQKLIIIAKKEKTNLARIIDFIGKYGIDQRKKCLIIDDEADTTGIGFAKVKDTDDFDLRKVSSKVNEIRGTLDGCVFLQVTATPYALYLQPEFDPKDGVKPIKPKKTFLVPSGKGYIGGEYYFLESKEEEHPGRFIFEVVSEGENALVSNQKRKGKTANTISDRRVFKIEDILTDKDRLSVFKKGIINFIVGGCCLREKNPKAHYSYIIHTATQKVSHIKLEEITQEIITQIKNRGDKNQPVIDDLLTTAYEDIKKSYETYGNIMPKISIIKEKFYKAIDKEYIKITTVNSDKDMQEILDVDNGELSLEAPFSIFVGGQILDRGVTIPKMIGFYYGRNPQTMQQDTVMQHSRMFGYRAEELLSVTRFYTTLRIYENMIKITEMDKALRETIAKNGDENGVYFLQQCAGEYVNAEGNKIKDRVIPCSPNKIAMSDIICFKPYSRILPIGFTTVIKSAGNSHLDQVNKLLDKLMPFTEKKARIVGLQDIKPILENVFAGFKTDEEAARFIDKKRFISTLDYLCGESGKLHLIVRRNRQLSKFRMDGLSYQDSPDTPRDERTLAKSVALNEPALILIHQNGKADGWGGREFWWPIITVPGNARTTIFAKPDAGGKVKSLK